MGSSIPAGLDYLYRNAKVLPECAAPVIVCDGFPGRAATALAIGVEPSGLDTDNPLVRADMGGNTDIETPLVPCVIWAHRVNSDPNIATSEARAAAFAIFDAVLRMIRASRNFGGLITGNATISDVQVLQTDAPEEASNGRICQIRFTITWKHHL